MSTTEKNRRRWVEVDQGYLHAVSLYGRLSGLEWACIATVWHHTWGFRRHAAELGTADFRQRTLAEAESVRRALKVLSTPSNRKKYGKRGHGMLHVLREGEPGRSRVWALEEDWRCWGWDPAVDLDQVAELLAPYVVEAPTPRGGSPDARRLASMLRDHCMQTVPNAMVPDEGPDWDRWVGTMEDLLDRHPDNLVARVIEHMHSDDFWGTRILGPKADLAFASNFDRLHGIARKALARRMH